MIREIAVAVGLLAAAGGIANSTELTVQTKTKHYRNTSSSSLNGNEHSKPATFGTTSEHKKGDTGAM
jgi:hypothetical protein